MIIIRILQALSIVFFAGVMLWGARMTIWSQNTMAGISNEVTNEETGFQFERPKMPWFLRKITQQNPDVPLEKGVVRRVPSDMLGRIDSKTNELLFRPDDLNITRTIRLQKVLPFAAFLNEGEAEPVPEQKILYVRTRAARKMAPYCREMLGTLAKGCAYLSTTATELKNDNYLINVTFAYVPAYELGAFSQKRGYEALTTSVFLNDFRASQVINTKESRKALYLKALQACEEVKKLYPNCVMKRIYLEIIPIKKAKSSRRTRKEKTAKKQKTLLKKAKRFGEKGAFGAKGGFGKKKKKTDKIKRPSEIDVRYSNETLSMHVVLGVYTIDTKDEEGLVKELGQAVHAKLVPQEN